ncbi:MAG: ABC transporter substrate-binding protein [Desulfovibrionaceae bacterium]
MKRNSFYLSAFFVAFAFMVVLSACGDKPDTQSRDWRSAPWDAVEAAARGGTVRWYMYGGFAHVNKWVDTYVAGEMRQRYGITLERVPMDAGVFVNKLLAEKQAGAETGSIDLLWVNGENFKNLRQAGALFGPYADRLPNFNALVDPVLAGTDFGFPVEGYETPYGQAQFVFEYDMARTPPPAGFEELATWVREHPDRFTYPQPPDFTGSAFIRQAFYALTGGHEQYMRGFDQELFAANAPKLWAYLNDIKPYLWEQGRAYPQESAALDTLFQRGEVDMGMSYHPLHAQSKILEGTYPDTIRTFVMREGAIFNLHFTAIPFNASNIPAAMVLANFLLSPEAQLSKLAPENWGDFPCIDLNRLEPGVREAFLTMNLGAATLPAPELSAVAVPEIPSAYLEALEKGWEEHVLR